MAMEEVKNALLAAITESNAEVLTRLADVEKTVEAVKSNLSPSAHKGLGSSSSGLGGRGSHSAATQQQGQGATIGAGIAHQLSHSTQQTSPFNEEETTGYTLGGDCQALGSNLVSVQDEFNSIKDKVTSVKLPPELRVGNSRAGIKRDDTNAANIIANSAKFAETTIKLLWNIEDAIDKTTILHEIFNVQKAHIDYLRQEHSALVVNGQFGQKTSQLFKNLSRGTTNLDDKQLDSLLKAVQITAADSRPPAPRGRGSGWRGGWRGSYGYGHYNRNSSGRGGYSQGANKGNLAPTPYDHATGNTFEGKNNYSE